MCQCQPYCREFTVTRTGNQELNGTECSNFYSFLNRVSHATTYAYCTVLVFV